MSRVRGSWRAIASGVNAGRSTCLAGRWAGGSEVIGGAGINGGGGSRTVILRGGEGAVSPAVAHPVEFERSGRERKATGVPLALLAIDPNFEPRFLGHGGLPISKELW